MRLPVFCGPVYSQNFGKRKMLPDVANPPVMLICHAVSSCVSERLGLSWVHSRVQQNNWREQDISYSIPKLEQRLRVTWRFPNIYCYETRLDSNEKSSQYSPPFSKVTGSTASLVNLEMARAQKWQAETFDCITRISHSPGSLFHSSCVT